MSATNKKTLIDNEYVPHPGQMKFHTSKARFRIICCFPPGQIILGDNKPVEEYKKGDFVLGKLGQLNEVTANHVRDYTGDLVTVKARYLLPMTTTADHKLRIHHIIRNDNSYAKKMGRRKTKTEWRLKGSIETPAALADKIIKPQDKYNKYCLRVPIIKGEYQDTELEGIPLTPDILWLMGLYIAEGNRSGSGIRLSLGDTEREIIDRVHMIGKKHGWVTSERTNNGSTVVYVGLRNKNFTKHFGGVSYEKKIPEEILLHVDTEKLTHLLKGYYDGDGYLNTKVGKLAAKTVSQVLAQQLQLANIRLGHPATISTKQPKPHILKSDGHLIKGRLQYIIEQINPQVIRKIGYPCHDKPIRRFAYEIDDSFYVPITKVSKKHYSGPVYNMSTDDGTILLHSVLSNCGRKWGKTTMLLNEALYWLGRPNTLIWWVAPYFAVAQMSWNRFLKDFPRSLIKKIDRKNFRIVMINDSEIWFKSADNSDSLVGEGIDLLIIDEAARIRERVWFETLRPNLSDPGRLGYCAMASTPTGHNFFYYEWLKGIRGVEEHDAWGWEFTKMPLTGESVQSFQGGFPTWSNPMYNRGELPDLMKGPRSVFFQEFAARFLSDLGSVFDNIKGAVDDRFNEYHITEYDPRETYYMGVDLGKTNDYTVITIVNSVGFVVYWERFRRHSWTYQVNRIIQAAKIYGGCDILIDSCYDDETEVLTDNGWKFFKDVDIDIDLAATLNPDTHMLEYQKPLRKIKKPYNGKMYYLKTNTANLMVTPNHHLYISKNQTGEKKYRREQAYKLYGKRFYQKRDAGWNGEEQEYFTLPEITATRGPSGFVKKDHVYKTFPERQIPMDAWLEFFGYWIAEGSASAVKGGNYVVQLRQREGPIYDMMAESMKNIGFTPKTKDDRITLYSKQLCDYLQRFGHASNKYIPKHIKQLSPRQLQILLTAYMYGDGSQTGEHRHKRCVTVSTKLRDDLMEIVLKIGKAANYSCYVKKGDTTKIGERIITARHDQWTIRITAQNQPVKTISASTIEEWVPYNSNVWCLEVPNHTLYIRRGGKPLWCCNTGLGDPVYDFIAERYTNIKGLKISSKSKKEIIENLSIELNNKAVSYPPIPELIDEMGLFGVGRTQGGTIKYEAPSGHHDDCVISLALAVWSKTQGPGDIGFAWLDI